MTTDSKLFFLNAEAGLQWGDIAEELGVSRQMICAVRRGLKKFSPQTEARLDRMIEKYESTNVNQMGKNTSLNLVDTDANSSLTARLDAVEARLSTMEQLLLRLVADADRRAGRG